MTTAREHFALDWIKADLLETLNDARIALDEYAEQGREETRLRPCLTALHQVHGTLVMLELKGVTQLADHLEQLAQAMLAHTVDDEGAAGQALMQGILELPGYLDELQRGAEDSLSTAIPLVNEIRGLLKQEALVDPAGGSLRAGASDEAIARFHAINGPEKVARIRSAYQSVLLAILKGEDRSNAVVTLSKIALGLEKVCDGTPLQRQWQAFGEFVASLKSSSGALEADAVKLLRRVDLEIKNLAKDGDIALQRPVNMELLQHLLEGAVERENVSATVTELREAVSRDVQNNTLAISGRQALGSAAEALQEDLAVIKDKLDLLVRTDRVDLDELRGLVTPLNQIGSTLSLLGFESSREIVADQVNAIENLVVMGDSDPRSVQSIAGALVQIDENLGSVILGSGATEVEQITSDAERQVLLETRKDLEHIKQCIVDFVTAHWSIGHLESIPDILAKVNGALEIIPLTGAITQLQRVSAYVSGQLMQGRRPEWEELDRFADVVSAIDYYLERLGDESSSGAEDILAVAERGLSELEQAVAQPAPVEATSTPAAEQDADIDAVLEEVAAVDAAELEILELEQTDAAEQPQPDAASVAPDVAESEEVQAAAPLESGLGEPEQLDTENLPNIDEPQLALEQDPGFDLSSEAFDELVESLVDDEAPTQAADAAAAPAPTGTEPELEAEPEFEVEPEFETEPEAGPDLDELSLEPADSLAEEAAAVDTAAPAEHPQVAALVAKLLPEEDVEPPDEEIVEIFVEEIDEVLANIEEYIPQWAADYSNQDALAEVRRAFHTLKGSGRIVQAVAIGELAWGIENMLNRVIDGTVEPNEQFVAAIDAARGLVPELRNAFAEGEVGKLEQVAIIIEQADLLSSGAEIDTALLAGVQSVADGPQLEQAADEQPADAPAPELEEALDEVLSESAEAAGEEASAEEATAEEAAAEQAIHQAFAADAADAQGIEEELPYDAAALDDLLDLQPMGSEELAELEDVDELSAAELFTLEAAEHLHIVQQENQRTPWALTEPLARAFHTLSGGAALAEMPAVQLIVAPAYQVVEAYRNAPPTAELQQFFVEAAQHLSDCLAAIRSQTEWEEPLEFVAHADDLLALLGSVKRDVEGLLEAPATAAIFAAESGFNDYLASAEQGQQHDSRDICGTLAELVSLADRIEREALAQLANSLHQALSNADQAVRISSGDATVLRGAYHQVIDQLNEIAAGSTPQPATEMVAALQALRFVEQAQTAVVSETAEAQAPLPEEINNELAELREVDADLVEVFFEEAEEINEELEAGILSWSAERENRLYMENLLRSLHTLKGGARLCGLTSLGEMAHDFESYVIEVQNDERPVDDDLFTELNRRYDQISQRVGDYKANFSDAVQAGADNVVNLPQVEAEPEQPTSADVVSAAEISDVNKVVEAVVAPPSEEPAVAPAKADSAREQATAAPVERGSQEMVRVGSALLEELVNLAGESSILRARIEQGMSDFTGALDEMEITIERLREQLRRLEIETETQILHRHERTDGQKYENFDPLEMDRYNQLQQLSRGLSESASDMLDLKETLLFKARESETLLLQQARINTELQEGLMRTRMVPFSRLMPRLRRIVRQVSAELDKQVEFHVQNAEGELDRNLLERMVPPLEHMLRNAVDHGIETVDLRRNYGKSPVGRIDLRLTREGGDVVIEISDDGAGIDVEGVRAKAIERGLMAEDAVLSDEEALQFVLAAGFSTAKSVTQISGRGVGLDVVHSEVKQLGGSVSIVSQPGQGTRFVIRVPFTVSVNRALMVSVNDDLYAIPLNTIEGIVLLSPEQLQALNDSDSKTFEYAGIPYRVRYLGQYLGREFHGPVSGQTSIPMVLVRSGDLAVAIHVDQVQGSREIVVKSLGPQFAGVGGISGATILGDGSVVVILDLLALIRAQHHERAHSNKKASARSGPRCVMVVDDSVTVRKVTSRLLERQGMDVLVAKDGIEAVALLQERRPDVMLLDIEMPRMDGFEVARQVRHDDRLGDLPIVMISSRTGDKHKEHASQLGVNKFLGKPFQENELLATIDELVAQ